MSTEKKLPWDILTWEKFQGLCVYLAEKAYPNVYFSEHLKKGATQDGIDILSDAQSSKIDQLIPAQTDQHFCWRKIA